MRSFRPANTSARYFVADRLNPTSEGFWAPEHVPALKARADIYFRLLDKSLPDLRPVDLPTNMPLSGDTLAEKGRAVIEALAQGELSLDDSASLPAALVSQVRITEFDELEQRVRELERSGQSFSARKSHAKS